MRKGIKTALECLTFGGLVFTLTLALYNLYAWRTGAPLVW